jgi:hypothetical protein
MQAALGASSNFVLSEAPTSRKIGETWGTLAWGTPSS